MTIRRYSEGDLEGMIAVWNEVVEAGDAFPQEQPLTKETGAEFFAAQSYAGVAIDESGEMSEKSHRERPVCWIMVF